MDLSLVSLICFIALTLGVVAIMMFVRDLAIPGNRSGRGPTLGSTSVTLRRQRTVFDESPARSVTGRIDQAFDRLVLETGMGMLPITGFMMILACGLLIGGVFLIYYDYLLSGVVGMIIGMIIPIVVMFIKRGRRLQEVRKQLPYVLDLLARAVRAGESLDQGIALIGSEVDGVLGKEFAQCARQLEMGRSIESVMKSLAVRIRIVELRLFATTLSVHRQSGGNLAETLERMGQVVRDRLTAQRQLRASTGAGRASALLIATISPVAYLVMFIWQPEHVRVLYEDPLGLTMLTVAVVLEIVGVLWVAALLRHDS